MKKRQHRLSSLLCLLLSAVFLVQATPKVSAASGAISLTSVWYALFDKSGDNWKWDAGDDTLYLYNGASISTGSNCIQLRSGSTISVSGTVTLKATSGTALYLDNYSLSMKGGSVLNITATSNGIQGSNVNLSSGTFNISAGGAGIYGSSNVIFGSGATGNFSGSGQAIKAGSGYVEVSGTVNSTATSGGIQASSGAVRITSTGVATISTSQSSAVGIKAGTSLTVDGTATVTTSGDSLQTTSTGAPVTLSGKVTASSSQGTAVSSAGTATVSNGTYQGKTYGIYGKQGVVLSGNATQSVTVTSTGSHALYSDTTMTVTHPVVTLSSASYGGYAKQAISLSGAGLTVSKGSGLYSTGGEISVQSSTLDFGTTGQTSLLSSGNLTLSDSTLTVEKVSGNALQASGAVTVTDSTLTVGQTSGTALQATGAVTFTGGNIQIGTSNGNGLQSQSGSITLTDSAKVQVDEVKGIALAAAKDILITDSSQLVVGSGQGSAVQAQGTLTLSQTAQAEMGTLGGNGLQAVGNLLLSDNSHVTIEKAGGYGMSSTAGTVTIDSTSSFSANGAGESAIRSQGLVTIEGTVTLNDIAGMGIQSVGAGLKLMGTAYISSVGTGIQTAQALTTSETSQFVIDSQSNGIVAGGNITFYTNPAVLSSITAVNTAVTTSGKLDLLIPSQLALISEGVGIQAGGDVMLGEEDTTGANITIDSRQASIISTAGHVFLAANESYYYLGGDIQVDASAGKTYAILDGGTLFFGMDSGSGIGISRTDFTLTPDMTPNYLVLRSLQVSKGYTFTVASGAKLKVGTVSLGTGALFIVEDGADVIFNGPSNKFEGEVSTSIPATLDFTTTASASAAISNYSAFSSNISWDSSTKTLTLTDAVIDVSSGSAIVLPAGSTVVVSGDTNLISSLSSTDAVISCEGDLTVTGGELTLSGGSSSIEATGDLTLTDASITSQGAAEASIVAENLVSTGSTIELYSDSSALAITGEVYIDNLPDNVTVEQVDGVSVLMQDGEVATILDLVDEPATAEVTTTTVVTNEDGSTTATVTNETTGETTETTQDTDGTTTEVTTDPSTDVVTTVVTQPDGTVVVTQDYGDTATVTATNGLGDIDLSFYTQSDDQDAETDSDGSGGDNTDNDSSQGDDTGGDSSQGDGTEGDNTDSDSSEGDDTDSDSSEGDDTDSDSSEGDDTDSDSSEGDDTDSDSTEGDDTDSDSTEDGNTDSDTEDGDSQGQQIEVEATQLGADLDITQGLGEEGLFITGAIELEEGVTSATIALELSDLGFDSSQLEAEGFGVIPVELLEDGTTRILPFSDLIDGTLMVHVTGDVQFILVDNTILFSDVTPSDWYYTPVVHSASREVLQGVGDNLFNPDGTTTCGMAITILYRLMGTPAVTIPTDHTLFSDVDLTAYYAIPMAWGLEMGVIDGILDGFQPEELLSRQQLALMLYQCAKLVELETGASSPLGGYSDSDSVADWAAAALRWAVASGLIEGRSDEELVPEGTATRGEMVTLLQRFVDWGLQLGGSLK